MFLLKIDKPWSKKLLGYPRLLRTARCQQGNLIYLILHAQLKLLESDSTFSRYQDKIRWLAFDLESLSNIPMVNAKLELILEVQKDDFWTDITVEILEQVRRDLRDLMQLIKPAE